MTRSPARIAADPEWLAHRFDEARDAIQFRHVPRAAHAAATFLTDEYLGVEANPFVLRRAEAVALGADPAPVHFIFHSAFCCSTLLARAFDFRGKAMGLKEPQILNDIVGWRHRGAPGPKVAEALDHALRLLARPFEPGEAIVIKPSNVLNGLAPALLKLRPDAKAVLLRAPLPVYLKSVAKKGMWGRLWVRDLLVKQIRENFVNLGFAPDDYLGLTDLQAAAVGWLAQKAMFAALLRDLGLSRVMAIDSETLLAAPGDALADIARLFGITLSPDDIAAIIAGPAFATDSKTGDAFTLAGRDAAYAESARQHGDEIDKVLVWADAVARNAGVAMD